MSHERLGGRDEKKGSVFHLSDYPDFNPEPSYEELERENAVFAGDAIFTDIDGTLTDNSGKLDGESVDKLKYFMDRGGVFVPVTGRARFESVRGIVERLDLPFIIINNGAEIFDREGERIYGSELSDEEVKEAYDVAAECGLIWMQNKYNPETGEEYLFSNFTKESEQAMRDAGIVDTVQNEEGRIGISARQATADEVMAIPGQNYKIQMMSPDFEAVQAAYDKFQEAGIPCMLNMQSKVTGKFHWVEVIRGTKHDGIQKLIDSEFPFVERVITMGDGGNDISMLKAEYTDGSGNPVENMSVSVRNASDSVVDATKSLTLDRYNAAAGSPGQEAFGVAVAGMVDYLENKHEIDVALTARDTLRKRVQKLGIILPGMDSGEPAPRKLIIDEEDSPGDMPEWAA